LAGINGGVVLTEKTDIQSLNWQELTEYVQQTGQKAFRGRQLYQWMHKNLVQSFGKMANLPKSFREELEKNCTLCRVQAAERQVSSDGTGKYLMRLSDGNYIESVLMKYKYGNSVCISTQVGCRMGCRFCASTVGGLVRNLTVSEMLGQIYEIQRITGERVSNVILMGIGEPLDNYSNVVKMIRMLSDGHGLQISQRNITLSTCGLVGQIRRLAEEKLAITLAISLHAPNDTLRQEMMPIAKQYSISEILLACQDYFKKTNRRITFEYSLIEGKNDSGTDARNLATLLSGLNCHVNLIPLNPVKGRMGKRPQRSRIEAFQAILERNHIKVTIRREMGSDIHAACGQLRNNRERDDLTLL